MVGVVAHQVNLENAVGSLGRERRLTVTRQNAITGDAGECFSAWVWLTES